ncbi:hypothetical protein CYV19_01995 [Natronobacterium gregoryi SP2]|uniref:Major facilitator superfamily protein n=2 Tax=Natronobacterium gregoryi TaxID=44930 RepID=L9Y6F3_NATGS|nr:major facilitator superfamily protein [Natronobacterium gregoryi SP2]PLK21891.1 hypothetical protein CYV19_01995 [Natronobacterium gregoryi SP2]
MGAGDFGNAVVSPITVATLALPFVERVAGLVAVTAVTSSVLCYSPITLTSLTASFPDDVRGTGLSSVRTGYMLIGAGESDGRGHARQRRLLRRSVFLLSAVAAVAVVSRCSFPRSSKLGVGSIRCGTTGLAVRPTYRGAHGPILL